MNSRRNCRPNTSPSRQACDLDKGCCNIRRILVAVAAFFAKPHAQVSRGQCTMQTLILGVKSLRLCNNCAPEVSSVAMSQCFRGEHAGSETRAVCAPKSGYVENWSKGELRECLQRIGVRV